MGNRYGHSLRGSELIRSWLAAALPNISLYPAFFRFFNIQYQGVLVTYKLSPPTAAPGHAPLSRSLLIEPQYREWLVAEAFDSAAPYRPGAGTKKLFSGRWRANHGADSPALCSVRSTGCCVP
jgi:hypothetical protein